MINQMILFLVRRKLGVKKFQKFRFENQKTNATYYFTNTGIKKHWNDKVVLSGVSLNWLLNENCRITKIIE